MVDPEVSHSCLLLQTHILERVTHTLPTPYGYGQTFPAVVALGGDVRPPLRGTQGPAEHGGIDRSEGGYH